MYLKIKLGLWPQHPEFTQSCLKVKLEQEREYKYFILGLVHSLFPVVPLIVLSAKLKHST